MIKDWVCTCGAGYRGNVVHCPLHASAPDLYEALKEIVDEGTRCLDIPVRAIYNIDEVDRIAILALAKAEVNNVRENP